MPCKDPAAQKAAQRAWYERNRESHIAKAVARSTARYREQTIWFNDLKSQYTCSHCPESDPICIDFHHPDPNVKESSVSDLLTNLNREKILEEIAKCIPLCSNCHRKEHRRLREEG